MFYIETLHIICKEWIVGCVSIISQAVELYLLQSIQVEAVVVLEELSVSGIWFLSILLFIEEL